MKVADVMTPEPVTVEAHESLERAYALMDRLEIRHLPVMQDGELCGLLSDRELLEHTGGRRPKGENALGEVRRAMRVPVESVPPTAEVNDAAMLMVRARADCVAVLNGRKLVGILSEVDILRAFVRMVRAGALGREHDPEVARVATREVVSAEPTLALALAREILVTERIRHLPIEQDGRTIAIVSDRDLRRALGRGLSASTRVLDLVKHQKLETIEATARLSAAAELLDRQRIGALVVTAGGKRYGIVTTADVLAHAGELPWGRGPARAD
jgi:CBS domain-containing protein